MPHGQLQNTLTARKAQQGTARVAKGRNQVHQLGLVLNDQALKFVDLHAVAIDWRADQLGAVKPKALNGGQKRRSLNNDFVAGVDHGFTNQVQPLLAAGGGDDLLGRGRDAFVSKIAAERFTQRAPTFGGAVLQHCAGVATKHLLRRHADAFHVKQRWVRKAAGKTDDAGLAQQLEQLPDSRGFNVVQARCKTQCSRQIGGQRHVKITL